MTSGGPWRIFLCAKDLTFRADERRLKKILVGIEHAGGACAVFGLNAREQAALRAIGGKFRSESDFEQEIFMQDVNGAAIRLAATWYEHARIAEVLTFQSINLGGLIQHPLTYFFLEPIRDIALLSGLANRGDIASAVMVNFGGMEISAIPVVTPAELFHRWYGNPTPLPKVSAHRRRGDQMRKAMKWLWNIRNLCADIFDHAGGMKILVSSDLKHADPVLPFLGAGLVCLRAQYSVRLFPKFLREGIRFYVPGAVPEVVFATSARKTMLVEAVEASGVFSYRGVPFWESILARFFESWFPVLEQCATNLGFFKRLLSRQRIRGVLVDEDVCPFNKTLVHAAERMNIPSVVIQHGAPFWIVPIALAPVSASRIAAWGPYSAELLREWGVPEEKIVLTGVPRYDAIVRSMPDSGLRSRIAKDLGIDAGKKWAVLATDPFHEPGRPDFVGNYLTQEKLQELVETVVRTTEACPEIELIIKLHPRDRFEKFSKFWVEATGGNRRIPVLRVYPTLDLVRACDVLLTVCSTVALEALLVDKPVITINMQGGRDLQPHAELGVALSAKDSRSILQALKETLFDEKVRARLALRRSEVIPMYVSNLTGNASERTANLLKELMRSEMPAIPAVCEGCS